jgi:hypothetical protein
MGALEGLSSQAHAHYGLARLRFSSNPLILWRDPRRFAMPDDVLTFGPAFAQTYTDLALLATLSDLPGSDCLAGLFAGAALHHLEDLSQPTHTVQVGAPRFLSGAVRDWLGEEIESLGGLLRSRPSFRSIGIGIIRNHHVLEEALLDQAIRTEARRHRQIEAWRQSQAPSVEEAQVLEAATRDDAELGELLRRSLPAAGQDRVLSFGEAIADALVELSSRRAAALYGLVYDLANPELRDIGFQVAGGVARPDSLLRPAGEAALVAKRAALRESWRASLGRGGTAVRLWLSYHDAVLATVSPDGLPGLRTQLLSRLGERLLAAHQATLARRRQYVPAPPEMERVNVWAPLLFLFALLAAALAGRRLAAWQAAGERDDGDAEQERDRA